MIEISRAGLMAWKLSHCHCNSIKSEYMCLMSGLTLRVWKECKVEEAKCESSQGDLSVGHMWPITALLKEAFGERPLQRFWVLDQLFNYISTMPCLNVFVSIWGNKTPKLPGVFSPPCLEAVALLSEHGFSAFAGLRTSSWVAPLALSKQSRVVL